MFLGVEALLAALDGGLVVEPALGRDAIGPASFGLRLGTEFIVESDEQGALRDIRRSVALGHELLLAPRARAVVSTLEYVALPPDLLAVFFLRASWARLGLHVSPGLVTPGFAGRLGVTLFNANDRAVPLRPGMSLLNVCLARVEGAGAMPYQGNIGFADPVLSDRVAAEAAPIATALDAALQADPDVKGKALEDVVAQMFTSADGFRVLRRNLRSASEEFDLLVGSDRTTGFWRVAGAVIVVECKNWEGRVRAKDVRDLAGKLSALGPDYKTAVLVAPAGVTGKEGRDATGVIREARQRGHNIIPLAEPELRAIIADGADVGEVIERRYNDWVLSA